MRSRRPWSIHTWLGGLAAAVSLPLLILLTMLFASEVSHERTEARNAALRIARVTAAQMQALHTDAVSLLERIEARRLIRDFDASSCDSLFGVVDFDPQDENLFFFDLTGKVVCSSAARNDNQTLSVAAKEWIADELRAGRLKPRTPVMRMLANRWVSVHVGPMTDVQGTPRGTVALLQAPQIGAIETLPPKSVLTVLDNAGVVLARSDHPEIWSGRNVRDSSLARVAFREKEGHMEAVGIDGVSRQYGFTYLPDLGWHVYVGIPTNAIMLPVRRLLVQGVIGGTALVLFVVAVALLLARRIQKPIDGLVRAAASLAEGRHPRVAVEGPREIALLAETFNEMAESRSGSWARMQESERNLKALSERLLVVQEEERARIAREIHDDLGQSLTALKMDVIGLLEQTQPPREASPVVNRIMHTLDSTVSAVQRISSELRPSMLDDLGLVAALESEAHLFEERSGIECEISFPENPPHIDPRSATAIYRIVQEALTNVARHSNASRVELRLRERAEDLLLEIRDDGRGIETHELNDPASLGLLGIRERAAMVGGTVQFEGVPGRGTIVSVRIPSSVSARSDR